jgi:hypothetical protein
LGVVRRRLEKYQRKFLPADPLDAPSGAAKMTDLALGIAIGAGGMFIAMVALILLVNHGPGAKVWDQDED